MVTEEKKNSETFGGTKNEFFSYQMPFVNLSEKQTRDRFDTGKNVDVSPTNNIF
jgi:hypothetical protein